MSARTRRPRDTAQEDIQNAAWATTTLHDADHGVGQAFAWSHLVAHPARPPALRSVLLDLESCRERTGDAAPSAMVDSAWRRAEMASGEGEPAYTATSVACLDGLAATWGS